MTRPLVALLVAAVAGACGSKLEAAPAGERARPAVLSPAAELCVTRGHARVGEAVTAPTMRAIAPGTTGDAAALEFAYRGDTEEVRALASGQARRQVGLKLRAQDGCNLVYVMWRLDPTPRLDVSVKRNAGAKDHAACGAKGYTKVRPTQSWPVPVLAVGDRHTLRAAIAGDDLIAWIDDRVAWRGTLPRAARALAGPAGLRSDNLAFDVVGFEASAATPAATGACSPDHAD